MMASYNRDSLIGEAIQSILTQSYTNWELLVLDDASTDNSAAVVRKFAMQDSRIQLLSSPQNLGITRNRNRGFAHARGEYIAVLDNDDLWLDQAKLAKQLRFLEENPGHVLVGTDVSIIDDAGREIKKIHYAANDHDIRLRLLLRNQFTHSSILMRRRALPSELPYDETGISIWEDYDLFLRLGQNGEMANLPEVMTAYRWHTGNISKTKRKEGALTHLKIIKKYRHYYPNYLLALVKGWLRYLIALVS